MSTTPLPPGAHQQGAWEDDTRVIATTPRPLPSRPEVRVLATAIQNRDGSINTDEQPPLILVDGASGGLTARDARALAMRLLDTANQIEAWQ